MEDQARIVLDDEGAPQSLFIDGVHLNRKAGAEVLSCLVTPPCNLGFQPTLLEGSSINVYLKQTQRLREQHARENPTHLAKMRTVLGLNKTVY